jgi:Zn-dependent peptidase ImmA (M78 family)/transcriptional regulator with XRE-family HTH domain
MARTIALPVTPKLLSWARETVGLDIATAARKAQVKNDQLRSWEAGSALPSLAQAEKLADAYKRPVALFLLVTPPEEPAPPRDFRTTPRHRDAPLSYETLLVIRRARRLQAVAHELRSKSSSERRARIGRLTGMSHPERSAAKFRSVMGVGLGEQTGWPSYYAALRGWRRAVQDLGFLVFQFKLTQDDAIRGLSLPHPGYPAVVLNTGDYIGSRAFSLFHEVAHLLLGRGGLCDMAVGRHHDATEIYCNHFAGAVLVPAAALLGHPLVTGSSTRRAWLDSDLTAMSREFKVSREVILRRLLILDRTTSAFYARKRDEWIEAAARRPKRKASGGLSPAKKCVVERGTAFAALVLDSLSHGWVSTHEASGYLGVRTHQLDNVAEQVGAQS